MTDEVALLAAILASPEDDTLRLVYADWLDENGQPERAEFIRVQVEKSAMPSPPTDYQRCAMLTFRECELLPRASYLWWPLPGVKNWAEVSADQRSSRGCCNRHADNMACDCARTAADVTWVRGFVESVTCTAADWLANADAIVASQPIRKVALTTIPLWDHRHTQCLGHEYRLPHPLKPWHRLDYVVAIVPVDGTANVGRALLKLEWPGIEFELPPSPVAV